MAAGDVNTMNSPAKTLTLSGVVASRVPDVSNSALPIPIRGDVGLGVNTSVLFFPRSKENKPPVLFLYKVDMFLVSTIVTNVPIENSSSEPSQIPRFLSLPVPIWRTSADEPNLYVSQEAGIVF